VREFAFAASCLLHSFSAARILSGFAGDNDNDNDNVHVLASTAVIVLLWG
jgi:hypothetical protein